MLDAGDQDRSLPLEARHDLPGRVWHLAKGMSKPGGSASTSGIMFGLSLGAIFLMTLSAGFGTGELGLGPRLGFWAFLIGWNFIKWQLWFTATIRQAGDWRRFALIGMLPLNLPLPFEVQLAATLFADGQSSHSPSVLVNAVVIGSAILLVALALTRPRGRFMEAKHVPPSSEALPSLLRKAGLGSASDLAAIEAEDHYCRIRRRDGSTCLVHHRFGQAVEAAMGIAGVQIHRSAWVASHAVEKVERRGRRWTVVLTDGTRLPVSASYVGLLRTTGWLRDRDGRGALSQDPA